MRDFLKIVIAGVLIYFIVKWMSDTRLISKIQRFVEDELTPPLLKSNSMAAFSGGGVPGKGNALLRKLAQG